VKVINLTHNGIAEASWGLGLPTRTLELRPADRRVLGKILGMAALAFALMSLIGASVRADVGVILNDSLDTSVARITGSGHSAVYLSRVCPESPIKLRLCRTGETGSVISNYTTLGEDQPFEWNVVPLSVYLYGVDRPSNRPLFASWNLKHFVEDNYRNETLAGYCASEFCQTSGKAEWREMVGATSERSFYILVASTTLKQDLDLIEKFNSAPNVNHFNAAKRNCADFTKDIVDTYFPHAAHRNVLNDFGVSSPKAVARSFAHYADHHPEMRYYVLHFAQLPGPVKRSTPAREGTEQLYRAKRLAVPLAVADWHIVPTTAMAYLLTGKFNPQREFELHATPRETRLVREKHAVESDEDDEQAKEREAAERSERIRMVGSERDWKTFGEQYESMVDSAVRDGLIPDRGALDRILNDVAERGTPFADQHGGLWMRVANQQGSTSAVGVSASTILAPGSDPELACVLTLARVERILKSPKHRRETMPEFKGDWQRLLSARAKMTVSLASTSTSGQDRVAALLPRP
jgi:hypothetical protein